MILAGALSVLYGLAYEISVAVLVVMLLVFTLSCLFASDTVQTRLTIVLTLLLGALMLVIVVGGTVFVVQDITKGTHNNYAGNHMVS